MHPEARSFQITATRQADAQCLRRIKARQHSTCICRCTPTFKASASCKVPSQPPSMLASLTRYKDANGVKAGAEKVAVLLGRNPVAVVVLLRWARQATVVGLHCSKAQTISGTSLTMVDVTFAAGTLLPSTSGAAPPSNRLQMVVQFNFVPL